MEFLGIANIPLKAALVVALLASVHNTNGEYVELSDVPHPTLGCFRDSAVIRLFPQSHDLPDNSPSACIDVCLQSGYQYAGVQYGRECWCGSEKPLPQFNINDDYCNMKCPNNPSEKCGGDLSMSVYNTGLRSGDTYSTMGCFRDSDKRLLPQLHLLDDNSPSTCIDVCLKSGYQYAGMQNEKECWCGSEKPLPQFNINEDQCNYNCPRKPLLRCGGVWAMNIFFTGLRSGEPYSTLGCFRDSDKRLLQQVHVLEDNSPPTCIGVCLKSGYKYAGVQYGKECWCGSEKPLPQFNINDGQCNYNCPKSPLLKCGGVWAMNVFYTGQRSSMSKKLITI